MKAAVALVILSLVGASRAGYLGNGATYSVRMPYSNPAGVTYIDGPAPAGLAAGPIVQPGVYGAVSPVARYAHYGAVAPVAQVAAPLPVAYTAAHVKTASVGYAAVPTVHHVPAVQDVPYTRIEATPGFVQKEVDVAKPAIATRKFEVRRPAIQKEFYDIEERVVVRPAGSAVVELDQPLSKTQKGETLIQTPAVAAVAAPVAPVAVARVAPLAPIARVAAVSPVAYAGLAPVARYSPFLYQSAHFAQPIVAAQLPQAIPTPFPAQPAQPEQPQQQFEHPQQPQQPQEQPQQQFEQPQQQFDQSQQQFDQSQQQFQQQQQQFQQQQQQFQQQFQQPQQDNSDDTVEVGNPEFAGRSAAPQPSPSAAPGQESIRQIKAEEEAIEAQRQELVARMAQLDEQRRQQQLDVAALLARQRNLNVAAAATVNPASFRSSQSFGQQSQLTEARFLPARPYAPQPQPQPQPQPESRSAQPQQQIQPQPQPEARSAQPNVEVRSLGSPAESLVPAARSGNDVVPSLRNLSPEQDQENQQRLIELLTARVQRDFLYLVQGGVAEVGNQQARAAAAALDAGQVRARVLSATPAPPGAEPTNERVSTRRVVVSRPIQTVQEVDVVEPFTKIHRLSVQQPAVFKTARLDVARVHTAVPVYGKALTPYTVYH